MTGDIGWSTIGKRGATAARLGDWGTAPIKMLHLELPMLTSIKINGLQTYGYHGLFEEERTLGQKFNFDISATLREVRTHLSDDLDSSVRYDAVVDEAVQIAGSAKFQTLEALSETIAAGLLRRFISMDSVRGLFIGSDWTLTLLSRVSEFWIFARSIFIWRLFVH